MRFLALAAIAAICLSVSTADAARCRGGACAVSKTVTVEKKVVVEKKPFDEARHPRDPATGQFTKRVTVEKSVDLPVRRLFRRGFCCR